MPRVAIVTDSTAYLPEPLARAHGIRVVALHVVVDGEGRAEGQPSAPGALARVLRAPADVSTSRPAPASFAAAYADAAREGAEAVVSVHLSSLVSGTYDAASLAAGTAPVPVHVVDSRSLGMGLGYAVLDAARAAADGRSAEAVATVAAESAAAADVLFCVDTLEHLRRGGRLGAAAALVGTALAVKPLLELRDGQPVLLEKVRTSSRAIARLEDLVVDRCGGRPVRLTVHHLAAEGRAEALAARLRQRLPVVGDALVLEVGPVVGAHVGPGMVATVVSPARTEGREDG